MVANVSSLTCYALLRAMETDLRDAILSVSDDDESEHVLSESLAQTAQSRRQKERGGSTSSALSQLLPYIDFTDAHSVLMRISGRLPERIKNQLRALQPSWGRIGAVRNRVAHARPLEIDDLPNVLDFAVGATKAEPEFWVETKDALGVLSSDPGYVLSLSVDLVRDDASRVMHNLPPADFDETGFLGRRSERKELRKAILGPWPVISVLGDGGQGKTALALQVAYDLLDDLENPFEAVVWTSAKNATLSSTEITRVETAIQSSLGLFAGAASELGSFDPGNEIDNLLEYLETFRILLILDNLETVLDDNVREFLRRLPGGSKALLTSRIGVGSTEYPTKLGPLKEAEATHLLRSLARVRGVGALTGLSDGEANRFVRDMRCHPGYVKWFVSGIQSGLRPESLIENNELLLDYCMSNVYDYLADESRAVLRSMMVLPGNHTLAELAYLNDYDPQGIQTCVLELTRTNFLVQTRTGENTTFDLADFARAYLQKHRPVIASERDWLFERREQLYAEGGELLTEHAQNPYSPGTINIRGVGDYHVAQKLRKALAVLDRGNVDEALLACREANDLAPGYHEVHRITALVHERAGDLQSADESYSNAVEKNPTDPYLKYFYGQFLVSSGFSYSKGLRYLRDAAKVNPESPVLMLAIARAHARKGNSSDVVEITASVLKEKLANASQRWEAWRLMFGAVLSGVGGGSRISAGLELVEYIVPPVSAIVGHRDMPSDCWDSLLLVRDWCSELAESPSVEQYFASRSKSMAAAFRSVISAHATEINGRIVGTVQSVRVDKGYAFITHNSETFFLHASSLSPRTDLGGLTRGCRVAFEVQDENTGNKRQAIKARWVRQS